MADPGGLHLVGADVKGHPAEAPETGAALVAGEVAVVERRGSGVEGGAAGQERVGVGWPAVCRLADQGRAGAP